MLEALQTRFEKIERYRVWFEEAVLRLGIERAHTPLGKNEWSLVEVIEHLSLAEAAIIKGLDPLLDVPRGRLTVRQLSLRTFVAALLSRGVKVPVPTETVLPKGGRALEEILLEWTEVRTTMKHALESILESKLTMKVFDHPVTGPHDVVDTLSFLDQHLRYHYVRVQRLARDLRNTSLGKTRS